MDKKIFTIELPEKEAKLFKQLLKKLNGKIVSQSSITSKETLEAMKELQEGKGVSFSSVSKLFKSIFIKKATNLWLLFL
ncbi:hypothetical protein [Sphingobacterium sp. NPDC055431]